MATELAKAYVQIIPSARGIQGSLTQALGGEASSAGASAGQSFGSQLVRTALGVISVAAIGKALGATITEGAALEQSIGGIETLFKDSADTVKAYADEAYRTAGMSANQYMEQTTSFAASLLQSLGGDTAAAAEVANMAMVDMSDNANKMGTDMERITDAYQGFAKQNYTMLDNLKLGYGGTKTEMERLLADAQKITGVKYDISSLADVYNAIHVIQGELDITGTTAKEAATTLSGSFNSMVAAGKNVLGKLTLGQDIGPSLEALAQTTTTFLVGNLLPAVGNILKGFPSAIGTFITSAGPQISTAIGQALGSVSPDLSGLWNSISSKLGSIWQSMGNLVGPISQVFSSAMPLLESVLTLADVAAGQLSDAFNSLGPAAESVAPMLQGMFDSINTFVQGNAPQIVSALASIAAGMSVFKTLTGIATLLAPVASAITGIVTAVTSATSAGAALSGVIAVLGGPVTLIIGAIAALTAGFIYLWNTCEPFKQFWIDLGTNITNFVSSAAQAIVTFFTVTLPTGVQNAMTFIQQLPSNIATFFSQIPYNIGFFLGQAIGTLASWAVQLPGLAAQAASTFLTNVVTFFSQLPGNIMNWLTTALTNVANWAIQLGQKGIEAAQTLVTNVVTGIQELPGKLLTIGRQAVEGLWNGIKGAAGWLKDQISSFVSGIVDGFTSAFEIGSPSRIMEKKVGYWLPPGIAEGVLGNMKPLLSAVRSMRDVTVGTLQRDLAGVLRQGQQRFDTWSRFGGFGATVQQYNTFNTHDSLSESELTREAEAMAKRLPWAIP